MQRWKQDQEGDYQNDQLPEAAETMVLKKKKIKKRKIEVSSKPIVNDKPKNDLHISDEELPDEKQVKANLD
jgi:hypothetical protein